MQKKYRLIVVLVILAGAVFVYLLNAESIRTKYLFFKLKLNKQNFDQAKPYMQLLAQTNKGADICINDLSVFTAKQEA